MGRKHQHALGQEPSAGLSCPEPSPMGSSHVDSSDESPLETPARHISPLAASGSHGDVRLRRELVVAARRVCERCV